MLLPALGSAGDVYPMVAFFSLVDRLLIDRHLAALLNRQRERLGLAPIRRYSHCLPMM